MAIESTLESLQETMMGYLLEPAEGESLALADNLHAMLTADSPAAGLAIYHHAYRSRLVEVLANDHEKLHRFLGVESFQRLAAGYVINHPSRVRSLRHFGAQLPQFLADSNHPDAARISALCAFERLLLDAYDAAFADQPGYEQLNQLPPEHWPALTLSKHPGVRLFVDAFGAVPAWQACNGSEGNLPRQSAEADHATQHWIIWRDRSRVCQFRTLANEELAALDAMLFKGQSLAETAEQLDGVVQPDQLAEALQQWLAQWFNDGLITAIQSG